MLLLLGSIAFAGGFLEWQAALPAPIAAPKPASPTWRNFREALRRHPTAIAGAVVLLLMILAAFLAPWRATVDPGPSPG